MKSAVYSSNNDKPVKSSPLGGEYPGCHYQDNYQCRDWPKVIQYGKVSFILKISQIINNVVEQYGSIDIRQGKRYIDRKEYRLIRDSMP